MSMTKENGKKHRGGRKQKVNPCNHRHSFNLNDEDNARFLSLVEASGMEVKAHFITACIFEKSVKVVKIDKGTMDFYMRLTNFYGQFRAIGVNYNHVIKAIKNNFSEKKALAFLNQLEKATLELVVINKQVMDLTREFEERWLQK